MINGGFTDFGEDAIRDFILAQLSAGAGAEIGFYSDTPSDTGGTELAGSGYARSPIVLEAFGTAGLRNDGAINGSTPTGTWLKAKGCKLFDENGDPWIWGELISTPQQIESINAGTDTITITAHGLSDNQRVVFRNEGGALPAGLVAATEYFVINSAANTFKVSTTEGGAAVDITDGGTGINRVFKCHFQIATPDAILQIPDNTLTFTID